MAFVISACFSCIFRLKSLIFIIFLRVLFGNWGNNANFANGIAFEGGPGYGVLVSFLHLLFSFLRNLLYLVNQICYAK